MLKPIPKSKTTIITDLSIFFIFLTLTVSTPHINIIIILNISKLDKNINNPLKTMSFRRIVSLIHRIKNRLIINKINDIISFKKANFTKSGYPYLLSNN